jgi:hypothetical protein
MEDRKSLRIEYKVTPPEKNTGQEIHQNRIQDSKSSKIDFRAVNPPELYPVLCTEDPREENMVQ